MTLSDWDKDIEKMTDREIEHRRAALDTLKAWPALFLEFKWTGLWVLDISLESEQLRRLRAAKK